MAAATVCPAGGARKESSHPPLPACPLPSLGCAMGEGAMGQPPVPFLWDEAAPPWQGCLLPPVPPGIPRDPLQWQRWSWLRRQGKGRAVVVMGRGPGSVAAAASRLPPVPWTSLLLWYWWGWARRQSCCPFTSPACPVPFWQLPTALRSARAGPGDEAVASAEHPVGLPASSLTALCSGIWGCV